MQFLSMIIDKTTFYLSSLCAIYRMQGNFGSGKRWRIWRMTVDSPNLFQPNFIQLKKVSRDKIHLHYYVGIRQW